MKEGPRYNQKGFLQLIVILVLLVVILSLLGVSLSTLFENKTLQENFSFVGVGISNDIVHPRIPQVLNLASHDLFLIGKVICF